MDYEKAYKEALERAEGLIDFCSDSELKTLENVFPELRESKDERIRKDIISYLALYKDAIGEEYESWIAWLEKQVNQDNAEDADILHRFSFYSYKDEPNVLYLSGLYVKEEYRNKGIGTKILEVADEVAKNLNCCAIRLKTKKDSDAETLYRTHGYNSLATEERDEIWLEKQGESIDIPVDAVLNSNEDGLIAETIRYKKEQQSEQNTHLPSFDEAQGTPIINQGGQKTVDKYKEWYDFIRWFVKQRTDDFRLIPSNDDIHKWGDNILNHARKVLESKSAEWSEENESRMNNLCHFLEEYGNQYYGYLTLQDTISWLKSLRPQKQWKPSDEQMKALDNALSLAKNCGEESAFDLRTLYEQLKKLRKE